MPNNLFESIYAGNDPRLGGLDPAMFQQLYQQYNGALQMWGPEAAQAVLQQQLAGLPQSPVGAGSTGGPGGRGGAIPSDFPTNVGAGSGQSPSERGPGGRGGPPAPIQRPPTGVRDISTVVGPGGEAAENVPRDRADVAMLGSAMETQPLSQSQILAGMKARRDDRIAAAGFSPELARAPAPFSPEAGRTGMGAGTATNFSPEAGRTGMGAGTVAPDPRISPEAGRTGMGAGTATNFSPEVGSAQRLGDIAAAAAGSAASQLAPNVGAGSIGGPGGRGGAGPMVSPEAGRTGMGAGTVSQRPAADRAMIGGARQAGAGTVTPTPRPVGAGSTAGPGGRGGAGPMVSPEAGRTGLGAGTTGPPSAFSPELARAQGAQVPSFSPEAGRTGLGAGTASNFSPEAGRTGLGAGTAGPPSIRSNVTNPADIAMLATAERSGAGTAGPPSIGGAFNPGAQMTPTSPTPGGGAFNPGAQTTPTSPVQNTWADGSPVSPEDQWMYDRWGPGPYTDEQIHEWLGTQQSQSLLGAGGSNFSDAPLGGGVEVPEKVVDEGFGVDSDFRGGGDLDLGGGDVDLGVGGQFDKMPGYDPNTWDWSKGLADIERQYGMIDEQRGMTFADQQRQQQQAQRGLPGAFNARGMLNSGQYNRAEGMQAGAFDRARGRTEMGFQAAEDALSRAELEANASGSFGAFQASFEEADRRAKAASNIGGAWY